MKTNNNSVWIIARGLILTFLVGPFVLCWIAYVGFSEENRALFFPYIKAEAEVVSSHPIYVTPSVLAQIEFAVAGGVSPTNGVPDVSTSPLPASQSEFWTFAIAIVVPLIVGGLKKLFPIIPKWALPISTPFVGLALGAALKALGAADMSWVDMGQAGAMAVMIRESWNKIVTEPIKGEEGAKTKDNEDIEKERYDELRNSPSVGRDKRR